MALICTSMSEAKSMVTSNRMPWQLGSKCLQDAVAATASFFVSLKVRVMPEHHLMAMMVLKNEITQPNKHMQPPESPSADPTEKSSTPPPGPSHPST